MKHKVMWITFFPSMTSVKLDGVILFHVLSNHPLHTSREKSPFRRLTLSHISQFEIRNTCKNMNVYICAYVYTLCVYPTYTHSYICTLLQTVKYMKGTCKGIRKIIITRKVGHFSTRGQR